jgi:hypothetical protein
MKLCINCKHFYVPTHHTPQSALCARAIHTDVNPVTGEVTYPHKFCSAQRILGCGEEAIHFEPKQEEQSHE